MTPGRPRHARRHDGAATVALYACAPVIVGGIALTALDPALGWAGVILIVAALLTGIGCFRYLGNSPDDGGQS